MLQLLLLQTGGGGNERSQLQLLLLRLLLLLLQITGAMSEGMDKSPKAVAEMMGIETDEEAKVGMSLQQCTRAAGIAFRAVHQSVDVSLS